MTFSPLALAAATVSPRKSRVVVQLPGIFEGQARAYPSLLWNVATTRYCACNCSAACTHRSAVQRLPGMEQLGVRRWRAEPDEHHAEYGGEDAKPDTDVFDHVASCAQGP